MQSIRTRFLCLSSCAKCLGTACLYYAAAWGRGVVCLPLRQTAVIFVCGVCLAGSVVSGAGAQLQCQRPNGAAPCLPGGLTTPSNPEPSLNLGAGNPVNVVSGHKAHSQTDWAAPVSNDPAPRFLRRHYHPNGKGPGSILGPGWSLDWETKLVRSADSATLVHADGSQNRYEHFEHGFSRHQNGQLKKSGSGWIWRGRTGQHIKFNRRGQMQRFQIGPWAVLVKRHHQAGPLHNLASSLEWGQHTFKLNYRVHDNKAYLATIQTPTGTVRYTYQAFSPGQPLYLVQVELPDSRAYRYHYTPSGTRQTRALTGIDIRQQRGQSFSRWRHWTLDTQGRVTHLALFPQHLYFHYERPAAPGQTGLTRVTQEDGKETQFHLERVGGQARLAAVTGAPCPGCTAPGTRAAYFASGHLKRINTLQLERDSQGRIHRILPSRSGWPNLRLYFDAQGRRQRWSSSLTGHTLLSRNNEGLVLRQTFSHGGFRAYTYDGAQRPTTIHMVDPQGRQLTTQLQWRGHTLTRVTHPQETQYREHDSLNRLALRTTKRPGLGPAYTFTSTFHYNARGQRVRHVLPEGGALHYEWQGAQLSRLIWEDASGKRQLIIQTPPPPHQRAGYVFGHGLHAYTTVGAHFAIQQLRTRNKATHPIVWRQTYQLDSLGRVINETETARQPQQWLYAYNRQHRLIGAQHAPVYSSLPEPEPQWFSWHASGALRAQSGFNRTYRPLATHRDPSGLPTTIGKRTLHYGPDRRLKNVTLVDGTTVRYRHNAFGHLIERQRPRGDLSAFWYENGQLVAEKNGLSRNKGQQPQAATPPHASEPLLSRRYLYAQRVPVGFIEYTRQYPQGQLFYIHTGLLGAPRLVTNPQQRVLWHASYSPTGQARLHTAHIQLNLRLPGQYADPDTGWHDNLHRTFDPAHGHYLEPDPLGPFPGGDALGYAAQQTRRYTDPTGLMLFAFDGTRNNAQTQSNVWKLAQRYQDGPVFYQAGPGNPYETDWDALTAYSAPEILARQWEHLLNTLATQTVSPDNMRPIDILGYSRGSAMARHFANQVSQHTQNNLFSFRDPLRGLVSACVDLRFAGLFDTVAQFGIAGSQNDRYDMTIDDTWQWVAHAIALNEHRWLFPLMVLDENAALNTIEAPFVGAHADIGGGIMLDEKGQALSQGDLSDISLNWMLWQARSASLRFSDEPVSQSIVSDPLLHDARSTFMRTIQNGDRRIDNANGTKRHAYQDHDPRLGRSTRAQVEQFIQRRDNWRRSAGSEVGRINLQGYATWLYEILGWQGPDPVTHHQ